MNGSVVRTYSDINTRQVMVTDLQSSQRYTLAVRAESPGGQSAAVLFEGTTLQNGELSKMEYQRTSVKEIFNWDVPY